MLIIFFCCLMPEVVINSKQQKSVKLLEKCLMHNFDSGLRFIGVFWKF